jgi:hypothetical protein
MNPADANVVEDDCGLGTAYERWRFYQLMDKWSAEYDVRTALEGPLDGMAGVRGVHCVGIARSGVRVVTAVTTEASAKVARAVYEQAAPGSTVDVRVVEPSRVADLPASDLVVTYHALPQVTDWRPYLQAIGGLARKVLVVAICNPHNWGRTAMRVLGGEPPPDVWSTETLAPALWELGRVRDHVYFDAPWWPDLPVSPGQSLLDRVRKIITRGARAHSAGPERDVVRASKHVYGPGRWPYFGGTGWTEELEPALSRHPAFDGAPRRIVQRMAHLHAFVVDVRPRTPQARRRLTQLA